MTLVCVFCVASLRPQITWAQTDAESGATIRVAGRSLDEYVELLSSEDRPTRLRAARTLGVFEALAGDALLSALDHPDAAVRFIAAEDLGKIGGGPLRVAVKKLEAMAVDENSDRPQPLSVRMASAFALCKAGMSDQYLTVLIEATRSPVRGTVCYACDLIGCSEKTRPPPRNRFKGFMP